MHGCITCDTVSTYQNNEKEKIMHHAKGCAWCIVLYELDCAQRGRERRDSPSCRAYIKEKQLMINLYRNNKQFFFSKLTSLLQKYEDRWEVRKVAGGYSKDSSPSKPRSHTIKHFYKTGAKTITSNNSIECDEKEAKKQQQDDNDWEVKSSLRPMHSEWIGFDCRESIGGNVVFLVAGMKITSDWLCSNMERRIRTIDATSAAMKRF